MLTSPLHGAPRKDAQKGTTHRAALGGLVASALALLVSPGPSVAADAGSFDAPTVRTVPLPNGGSHNTELTSVSCVDSKFCLAVGTYRPKAVWSNPEGEHPVVMRFDGRRWAKVSAPVPLNAELNGLDCLSRSHCVAVGERLESDGTSSPFVEQLSGAVWSVTPLTAPTPFAVNAIQLQAVSCVTAASCTAVGWDRGTGYPRGVDPVTGLVAKEVSGRWTVQPLAPLVPMRVNSALGSVVVPSNAFDPNYLMSVSCAPRCVAVGQGQAFAESAQGWSPITTAPLVLNGVTCGPGQPCLAVGTGGQGMAGPVVVQTSTAIARLSGAQWRRVSSPNTSSPSNVLNAVGCWDARCVAVGAVSGSPVLNPSVNRDGGVLVEMETGGRWTRGPTLRTPGNVDDTLTSVSCPTRQTCVAVGQSVLDALRVPSGPIHALSVLITR